MLSGAEADTCAEPEKDSFIAVVIRPAAVAEAFADEDSLIAALSRAETVTETAAAADSAEFDCIEPDIDAVADAVAAKRICVDTDAVEVADADALAPSLMLLDSAAEEDAETACTAESRTAVEMAAAALEDVAIEPDRTTDAVSWPDAVTLWVALPASLTAVESEDDAVAVADALAESPLGIVVRSAEAAAVATGVATNLICVASAADEDAVALADEEISTDVVSVAAEDTDADAAAESEASAETVATPEAVAP